MKILTYCSSLVLSTFTYMLFAAYMTVSAGVESALPLVSFFCSLVVFGFLSWFHLYEPRLGALLLTAAVSIMFLSWPMFLIVDYFDGDYRPAMVEFLVPLVLTIATIFFVWRAKARTGPHKSVKLILALLPAGLAVCLAGYFIIAFWG